LALGVYNPALDYGACGPIVTVDSTACLEALLLEEEMGLPNNAFFDDPAEDTLSYDATDVDVIATGYENIAEGAIECDIPEGGVVGYDEQAEGTVWRHEQAEITVWHDEQAEGTVWPNVQAEGTVWPNGQAVGTVWRHELAEVDFGYESAEGAVGYHEPAESNVAYDEPTEGAVGYNGTAEDAVEYEDYSSGTLEESYGDVDPCLSDKPVDGSMESGKPSAAAPVKFEEPIQKSGSPFLDFPVEDKIGDVEAEAPPPTPRRRSKPGPRLPIMIMSIADCSKSAYLTQASESHVILVISTIRIFLYSKPQ